MKKLDVTFESARGSEFEAVAVLEVPWRDLPSSVDVTLWVNHSFVDPDPDENPTLELNIFATGSDGEERGEAGKAPLNKETFPFFPSRDHTIPLTLGDVQDGNVESFISAEGNRLLEEFVNAVVALTTCTLRMDENTGDLTAELSWKETGDLIVGTRFTRSKAES